MSALHELWRIEHDGPGPVVAIVRAATSSDALEAFRRHLESYEGCYHSTGSQRIEKFTPDGDPGIICVGLRPF